MWIIFLFSQQQSTAMFNISDLVIFRSLKRLFKVEFFDIEVCISADKLIAKMVLEFLIKLTTTFD